MLKHTIFHCTISWCNIELGCPPRKRPPGDLRPFEKNSYTTLLTKSEKDNCNYLQLRKRSTHEYIKYMHVKVILGGNLFVWYVVWVVFAHRWALVHTQSARKKEGARSLCRTCPVPLRHGLPLSLEADWQSPGHRGPLTLTCPPALGLQRPAQPRPTLYTGAEDSNLDPCASVASVVTYSAIPLVPSFATIKSAHTNYWGKTHRIVCI